MIKHILTTLSLLTLASAATAGDIKADLSEKPFIKKRYSLKGTATIETHEGQNRLVFSDDFKTKDGPDLKIYLSKTPLSALSAQDINQNGTRLSVLKSNKGAQNYIIPENINLDDYKSIVIQCEAFVVLWGGFDL